MNFLIIQHLLQISAGFILKESEIFADFIYLQDVLKFQQDKIQIITIRLQDIMSLFKFTYFPKRNDYILLCKYIKNSTKKISLKSIKIYQIFSRIFPEL